MKKTLTSAFIVLLLLPCIWGGSAWLMGVKNEQNFSAFIKNESQRPDAVFHYELLNYDRSIFSAKANIRIKLNPRNTVAQLIQSFVTSDFSQDINIDITHGPILFIGSKLNIAYSAMNLELKNEFNSENNSEILESSTFNKNLKLKLIVGFEDTVDYELPIEINSNRFLITGLYGMKSDLYQGKMSSKKQSYQIGNHNFETSLYVLQYKLSVMEKTQLELAANISELVYSHPALADKIKSGLAFEGDISIEDNSVNSDSAFLFDFVSTDSASTYPIDTGELKVNISDLKLDDLLQLINSFAELNNLQQQSQWLVEEQGEYPEGQDKIWLMQDSLVQYSKKLPDLVSKVLTSKTVLNNDQYAGNIIRDKNTVSSRVKFNFKSEYKNKQSSLTGALFPTDFEVSEDTNIASVASLSEVQAQVNLADEWFLYLSKQLPISNSKFKLIFKQNKLLMQ